MVKQFKFFSTYLLFIIFLIQTSCKTLEKASSHGFNNGYYKWESNTNISSNVYLEKNEDKIEVYQHLEADLKTEPILILSLEPSDSLVYKKVVFRKQSLDIDLTSVLLKFRPSIHGLQPQLVSDLNMAVYAGWRQDKYTILQSESPLGKYHSKITNFGYDAGIFFGPGVTTINPFSTVNRASNEYSAMILQLGIAGFLESSIASFGLALGTDYLTNSDRNIWIYQGKPWVGLVVGVALN
jgi:hypothetical protein